MLADREGLLRIANAVSDGERIDWDRALAESTEEPERQVLGWLRALAGLAEVHRSAEGPAVPPDLDELLSRREVSSTPALREWSGLEILEKLGEGSFAEVFRARDPKLEREVALKLLKPGVPRRGGAEPAMIREARLFARVRHPNIATVYGAETSEGRSGFWMELVRGRSLESLLAEKGAFGPREAALVGIDLCRALAAVHGAGLLHRDVKAANVMREEGGRILLMDFGAGEEASRDRDAGFSGTPMYMAPELFRRQAASPPTDLYALGVLLFHLVTRAYPVSASSMKELTEAHARGDHQLLRDLRPDLPEPFVRAVEKAIASAPSERFRTAGQMERALTECLGAQAAPAAPATSRRPIWIAAGAGAGLLAIGWALTRNEGKRGESPAAETAKAEERKSAAQAVPPSADPKPAQTTLSAEDQTSGGPIEAPAIQPPAPQETPAAAERPEDLSDTSPKLEKPAVPPALPPPLAAESLQAILYREEDPSSVPVPSGSRIRPSEKLYLEVRAPEPLYLYIASEDDLGRVYLLFPSADGGPDNPIPAGKSLRIPGTSWIVMASGGGWEHLLLAASRDPLPLLEAEVRNALRPKRLRGLERSPLTDSARQRRLQAMAEGRANAAASQEEPDPMKESLFRRLLLAARRYPDQIGVAEGIWVRRIDLENPFR